MAASWSRRGTEKSWSGFRARSRISQHVAYLADLAVHREYQRQGIGTALVERTRRSCLQPARSSCSPAPLANEYYPKIGFTHNPARLDDAVSGEGVERVLPALDGKIIPAPGFESETGSAAQVLPRQSFLLQYRGKCLGWMYACAVAISGRSGTLRAYDAGEISTRDQVVDFGGDHLPGCRGCRGETGASSSCSTFKIGRC